MLGSLPMDKIVHKLDLDTKLTRFYKELENKIKISSPPWLQGKFGQGFNRGSKSDFQTQIHDNNTQNDPYMSIQQEIEAKIEKEKREKRKI